MKTPFILLLILSLAAVPVAHRASAEAEAPQAPSPAAPRFDLTFQGGAPSALVEQIAKQSGQAPNVIIGESARDITIPPFELFSVTVDEVFVAVSTLFDFAAGGNQRPVIKMTSKGIYIVEVDQEPGARGRPTRPAAPVEPETTTRIFHIGAYLADYELEDVTTAIETAWEMAGVEENGRLRYHEETELLFVRGDRLQVGLVEQVLSEIRRPNQDISQAELERRREKRAEAKRRREMGAEIQRRHDIRRQQSEDQDR